MSIVLNEYEWAEQVVREPKLGSNAYETLCRVAKYYKAQGSKRSEIRKRLEEFLLCCDPFASVVLWSDTLERAVKVGMKYPPVAIDAIAVTKPEMETIRKLDGVQLQRLAFTLLCVAKYRMAVAPNTCGWVSTPENEIMKMASLKPSYKRQNLMYGRLLDAGLLRPAKKISNLNVQVLFMQDGETALEVRDFRDLGSQYMMYLGKPYFVCSNCGLTVKVPKGAKRGKMKYCPDCAAKISAQNNVNSVVRSRKAAAMAQAAETVQAGCTGSHATAGGGVAMAHGGQQAEFVCGDVGSGCGDGAADSAQE